MSCKKKFDLTFPNPKLDGCALLELAATESIGSGRLLYSSETAGTVSYESTVPALTTLNSEYNNGTTVFNCAGRVNIPLTQFTTSYSTQTFTASVMNNQFGTAVGTYKSTIISGNYVVDGKTLIWELDDGVWPTSPQYTLGANPLFVAPGVRPVFYEDNGGIIRALITASEYGFMVILKDEAPAVATWSIEKQNLNEYATYTAFGKSNTFYGDRIAIGAEDGSSNGQVNIYKRNSGTGDWEIEDILLSTAITGVVADQGFGQSCYLVSETQLLVGSPQNGGGINGRVYYFTYNGASWDLTQTLLEVDGGADPSLNDLCGYSIDVYNGTTLVVGAPGFTSGAQRGAILIYDLVAGIWTFKQRIINTISMIDSNVGYSVAIYDSTIVAGNWIEGPVLNDGKVFIYSLKDGQWEYVQQVELASKTTNDEFGKSVALYNKVFVVGAPGNDAGATDAGKVTVYKATSFASNSGASLITYPSSLPNDPNADSVVGLWCAYNTVNTYAGCVYGKDDDTHFALLHSTEAFTLKDEEDNSLKVTYNLSGTFNP